MGRVLGWTESDKAERRDRNRAKKEARVAYRLALLGSAVADEKPALVLDTAHSVKMRNARISDETDWSRDRESNRPRACHVSTTELPDAEFDAYALHCLPHMPCALRNALIGRQFCYLGDLFIAVPDAAAA